MASSAARKEAKNQLGKFDTSGYKKQREVAKNVYDTSVSDANNQWSNLQNQLNIQRKASASDFNQGRATTSGTQYLANRAEENRRMSGGLNGSGYDSLNNVSNRLALDKQQSDIANTYYNALEGIQNNENQGQQTYNTALDTARNVYNSALADVDLSEQGAKNNYRQALANLAEQIQARWDANAAANAALEQAKEANKYQIDADKANRANKILSGLSDNPSTLELTGAYNNLAAMGFDDEYIQNALNNATGRSDIYYNGVPRATKFNWEPNQTVNDKKWYQKLIDSFVTTGTYGRK